MNMKINYTKSTKGLNMWQNKEIANVQGGNLR